MKCKNVNQFIAANIKIQSYYIGQTFPHLQQAIHSIFSLKDLFPIIGRQNENIQVLIAALCRQTTVSARVSCQKSQSKSLTKRVKPALTQSELGCLGQVHLKRHPCKSTQVQICSRTKQPPPQKSTAPPHSLKERGVGSEKKDIFFCSHFNTHHTFRQKFNTVLINCCTSLSAFILYDELQKENIFVCFLWHLLQPEINSSWSSSHSVCDLNLTQAQPFLLCQITETLKYQNFFILSITYYHLIA